MPSDAERPETYDNHARELDERAEEIERTAFDGAPLSLELIEVIDGLRRQAEFAREMAARLRAGGSSS